MFGQFVTTGLTAIKCTDAETFCETSLQLNIQFSIQAPLIRIITPVIFEAAAKTHPGAIKHNPAISQIDLPIRRCVNHLVMSTHENRLYRDGGPFHFWSRAGSQAGRHHQDQFPDMKTMWKTQQ